MSKKKSYRTITKQVIQQAYGELGLRVYYRDKPGWAGLEQLTANELHEKLREIARRGVG